MTEDERRRIEALCARLADFIQRNDSTEQGLVTLEECDTWYSGEPRRSAWVTDSRGIKWTLRLKMSRDKATDVLVVNEIDVCAVKDFLSFSCRRPDNVRFGWVLLAPNSWPHIPALKTERPDQIIDLEVRRKFIGVVTYENGVRKVKEPSLTLTGALADVPGLQPIVEFTLDSVEALMTQFEQGTVTKNEREIEFLKQRRQRAEEVKEARARLYVLTSDQRYALKEYLKFVKEENDSASYMADGNDDLRGWLAETRVYIEENFLLAARRVGADVVVLFPVQNESGYATGSLRQKAEYYSWREDLMAEVLRAMEKLNEGKTLEQGTAGVMVEGSVEVLAVEELAERKKELELVAELDVRKYRAILAIASHQGLSTPEAVARILKGEAKALGGQFIVFDRPQDITSAKVYRKK